MKNEKDFLDGPLSDNSDLFSEGNYDPKEKDELLLLSQMLHKMPDRPVPSNLVDGVLRSVKPKHRPIWRRLYIWAVAPRIMTFRPIIPSALVFALGLFVALQFVPWREGSESMDTHTGELAQIRFTLFYPKAQSVSVIGSFNQWKSHGYEMKQATDGNGWVLELELSKGRYEYAFLVDGKVIVPDPNVPFSQSDGFGNSNSVLLVSDDAKNII